MFHPKKLIAILGISTFLLTPFAPSLHIAGADSVFAGNGNGNGGGNGGGGGNSGGNGGGNSGGNSHGNGNGNGGGNAARTASAEDTSTHGNGNGASGLGNMNGALHANVNAVLAHIRNGNTNGPVGRIAAVVAADAALTAATAAAADLAAIEEQWVAFEEGEAAALSGTSYTSAAQYQQTLSDYNTWLGTDQLAPAPTAPDGSAFAPVAAIDTYLASAPTSTRPTPEELAAAEAAATKAQDAVTEAEAAILAKWNKNPDADPATISPEEQALLDSLRARFSAEELAAIAEATAG